MRFSFFNSKNIPGGRTRDVIGRKEKYINVDNLNKLLSEDPFKEEPKGNTPIENRKAQGKMTGEWTSYDKVENFDIFS